VEGGRRGIGFALRQSSGAWVVGRHKRKAAEDCRTPRRFAPRRVSSLDLFGLDLFRFVPCFGYDLNGNHNKLAAATQTVYGCDTQERLILLPRWTCAAEASERRRMRTRRPGDVGAGS